MEEDFGVTLDLICLASNIRKEVCGVCNGLKYNPFEILITFDSLFFMRIKI